MGNSNWWANNDYDDGTVAIGRLDKQNSNTSQLDNIAGHKPEDNHLDNSNGKSNQIIIPSVDETVQRPKVEKFPARSGKLIVNQNLPVLKLGIDFFNTKNMVPLTQDADKIEKKLGSWLKYNEINDLEGPYLYKDGSTYYGQKNANNMRDGLGKLVAKEGNIVYEGEFLNEKMEGKGRIIWPDWSFYIGAFKDGSCNGQGQLTKVDGYFYIGAWRNNKQDGFGQERYPDDTIFVGNFKDALKNGNGELRSKDGTVFRWEFQNGLMNGIGSIHYKNGTSFKGYFKNGSQFEGEKTYLDGSVYTGLFLNNKREGNGKLVRKDKTYYQGEWSEDLQNGIGREYSENGTVLQEGRFMKGKYIGK